MSRRFLARSLATGGLLAVLVAICSLPARATGWVVGGNGLVIRSSDGGQSWSSSSPATATLNGVHFTSETEGWAVGNSGIALHTSDGGDHWTQTSPGALNLNAVFFADAMHGWIVGESGKILRTTNGGASWTTSTPTSAALYGVCFLNQNQGWAVGKGVVLRTTNGGVIWTSASPTTQTLRGVDFFDANHGWAVGSNGVVLKSTDGGSSWSTTTETPSDLYAVDFASATSGWAVGETGAVLTTTDGGAHWSAQRVGAGILRSVHFVDEMNGWAVGQGGIVADTGDGGVTWSTAYPATVTLNGVFVASLPARVSVTVATNPAGLSFNVDGVDYTDTQTFHWTPGSAHTIATTSPQTTGAGTRFVWSAWSNGGAISQVVAPESNVTYTASFAKQHYLTMQTVANGTVAPASGWFDANASVPISATPDPGFAFNGWAGSGSGSYSGWANPARVTMTGPVTETPSFGANVTVVVKSVPAGRSFVVDGTTYTAQQTFTWTAGSSHTLDAPSPQPGGGGTRYVYERWSDNGDESHSIAPVSNTTCTATFVTQYLLTTQAGTGGSVAPASDWRDAGASVKVTAMPDSGYAFQSWTGSGNGSYSGSTNPRTITMNGPVTQQANFVVGTAPALPGELTLLQNAPNPATTETDFRFGLTHGTDVKIEVFDVAGRRVFDDVARGVPGGWQTYRLNIAATPSLRTGIYFLRVTAAGQARSNRFVIIR